MHVDRRSFVKGIAAGGALLVFGAPRPAFAAPPAGVPAGCTLLLGHPGVEAAFARGVRAVLARAGCRELGSADGIGGPIASYDALRGRLERAHGTRWIAVLDDGGAALFQELVRSAGARLLARGSHACSPDGAVPLRHVWVAASRAWSAGPTLASALGATGVGFSVAESFFGEAAAPAAVAPGAGDERAERSGDWIECVGRAVALAALGRTAEAGPPVERSFVHPARAGERTPPTERFASFVVDL